LKDPWRRKMGDQKTPAPDHGGETTAPTLTTEEIGRLGEEIYDRDIRGKVEPDHIGEVIVIDVDSGDYAIADTGLAAADALRKRRPAPNAWAMRVGYRAMHSFGGANRRRVG